MGGGGSKQYKAPVEGVPSREDPGQRALMFQDQDSIMEAPSVNVNTMRNSELDDDSRDLLIEAFGDFFMMDGEDFNSLKIKLLLQACTRESSPANVTLVKEGEIGNKLYVVQSGHLEVSIEGDIVRHLTTGALFGEISLFYDAPRSATVKCLTACTFFVLTREAFRQVQGIASSASLFRRSKWLQSCASTLSLGIVDVSRLAGTLETHNFVKGEKIYTENELSNRIYLIEEGQAMLTMSGGALNNRSVAEVRKLCGVTALDEAEKVIDFSPNGLNELPDLRENELLSPRQVVEAMEVKKQSRVRTLSATEAEFENMDPLEVSTGCVVGTILIAPCDMSNEDRLMLKCKKRVGAKMPFTLEVTSDRAQCSYFTVDNFEHMFGTTPKDGFGSNDETIRLSQVSATSMGSSGADLNRLMYLSEETCLSFMPQKRAPSGDSPFVRPNRGGSRLDERRAGKALRFMDESFRELCLLGKGSYGTVTYARDVVSDNYYAIKRIHKADARSSQHIRHVYDECKILLQMKCPFIVNILGMYMTTDDVVLVMEPVLNGDLWGVIYEVKRHSRGLPVDLVRFYAASLVLGLAHMHKRGIAFRDLKPENIMINDEGFVTIIDFGFAKKIPYVSVDQNGVKLVKMRSYTLCGTPDYLAPEFIFNSGVNHSVDIWALGVIIHEMIMLATPFRPARKSDLTALFVNIASVKKIGLKLSSNIDYRTGDAKASQLIMQLLKADPSCRLGALDSTLKILDSPFFDGYPISALRKKDLPAPFVPPLAVDVASLKADSRSRYVREKKPYTKTGSHVTQWEAFNSLISNCTSPA